jgi:hypothetical protein
MQTGALNQKLIGEVYCRQYQAEAKFYIRDWPDDSRELCVVYDNGRDEFVSEIPAPWTEQDVLDLIFWPMKDPDAPYPAWEVPARVYGSWSLFRWWTGEKPE